MKIYAIMFFILSPSLQIYCMDIEMSQEEQNVNTCTSTTKKRAYSASKIKTQREEMKTINKINYFAEILPLEMVCNIFNLCEKKSGLHFKNPELNLVSKQFCSFKYLTISSLNFEGKIKNDDVMDFVKFINKLPNIKSLSLKNTNIGNKGLIGLAKNLTLTALSVENDSIDNEGAGVIARNPILTSLSLENNLIGDGGAIDLAENTTFRFLNVAFNNITEVGEQFLRANTTLQTLHLGNPWRTSL